MASKLMNLNEAVRVLDEEAVAPRVIVLELGSAVGLRLANDVGGMGKGTLLEAAQISAAASAGASVVEVFAPPRVAVLGVEQGLVDIDQMPGEGQVRHSNNLMLAAMLGRMGCETTDLSFVGDDRALLKERMALGLRHDAMIVTGTDDRVAEVMRELGVEVKIEKAEFGAEDVFVFGVIHRAPLAPATSYVFGLPAGAVEAMAGVVRLAGRVLARLGGGEPELRWKVGVLAEGMQANGLREVLVPGVSREDGVRPVELARANVLIVREANAPAAEAGAKVRVLEV